MSEAETDREILLYNLHCQSRPVVGAGRPEQNEPLLQQPGLPGASAARQGPTGFDVTRLGAFVAYNGCCWTRVRVRE